MISQVVYTRNIPEPDAAANMGDLPSLFVIDNPVPRGFGQNHNAAFRLCRAPFFCVLNPDIEWTEDPFSPLLACLDRPGSDRGLVAPVVLSPAGEIENTARKLYTFPEMLAQKWHPKNHGRNADWLAGMFLLFRSQVFKEIQGFDERYFLYIEDVDICSRLRLAGWALAQCQDASVIHDARNSSHSQIRYTRWHLAGMLRYWRSASFWCYRALLLDERKQARRRRGGAQDSG